MKNFCLNFIIILTILFHLCHSQNDRPIIEEVSIVSENRVKIKWTMDNANKYNLTRYRVLYAVQNPVKPLEYLEWPAQLKTYDFNTIEHEYSLTRVDSTLDCLNTCAIDSNCKFVLWMHKIGDNCYLKHGYDSGKKLPLESNAIAMILKEYENETFIDDLPFNQLYQFKVLVFDELTTQWLESQSPLSIDTTIDLHLDVKRVGFQFLRFKWSNPNFDFKASRFNLKVLIDNQTVPSYEIRPFDMFKLEPSFYDLQSPDAFILTYSADHDACFSVCSSVEMCVAYAYSNKFNNLYNFDNEWCILKTQVDMTKGQYNNDAKLYIRSILNQKREYIYTNFADGHQYQFTLEGITPQGFKFKSQPHIIKTEFKNLNLKITPNINDKSLTIEIQIAETLTDPRVVVFINNDNPEIQSDHYYELTNGYNDSNKYEVTAENFNQCHEFCIYDWSCLAVEWNKDREKCMFIKNIDNPKDCPRETICSTITKYSNKLKIEERKLDENYCISVVVHSRYFQDTYIADGKPEYCTVIKSLNVKAIPEQDKFMESQSAKMKCTHNPIDSSFEYEIVWTKDNLVLDETTIKDKDMSFEDGGATLVFNKLDRKTHNGHYKCSIDFNPDLESYESNLVTLKVDYPISLIVPNKMEIAENNVEVIPCIGEGQDEIELIWRRLNSDVDLTNVEKQQGNILSLIIQNATSDWTGTFVCYVKNNMTINATLDILVLTKPSKVKIESVKLYEESIDLKWSSTNQEKLPITNFDIQIVDDCINNCSIEYSLSIPSNEASKNEYKLLYRLKNTAKLQVRATNEIGSGEYGDIYILYYSNINKKPLLKHPYFVPFVVFVIVGLILVILLGIVIKRSGVGFPSFCKKDQNQSFINLSYSK